MDTHIDETERDEYAFGHMFWYWHSNGHHEHTQQHAKYWLIPEKFSDFKKELLSVDNRKLGMDMKQYQFAESKAERLLKQSQDLKALRSDDEHGLYPYGIRNGSPLSAQHAMSIVFYCSCTLLSAEFSKSFRKVRKTETDYAVKARHSKWYHFGKLVRETVELYGTKLRDSRIQFFYHGVSMIHFSKFIANFCCPTSTTTQFEVATAFTDESKGVILQLEKTQHQNGLDLKYFNCTLLSRYAHEDERLFIGGMAPLQIASMWIVQKNQNLRCFVRAITLFGRALDGDDAELPSKEYRIIEALAKGKLKGADFQYVNDCFCAFTADRKQIAMNAAVVPLEYRQKKKPLLVRMNEDKQNIVVLERVMQVFVNVEVLRVCKIETKVNEVYVAEVLQHLEKVSRVKREHDKIAYKLSTVVYEVDNVNYMIAQHELDALKALKNSLKSMAWTVSIVQRTKLMFTAETTK